MTLISIVMPMYCAEATVANAVRSVLEQTLTDIELLIVDDASCDRSVEVAVNAAAGDERMRMLQLERNGGVSAARNVGFHAARGKWIAVLDADDSYEDNRLAIMMIAAAAADCDILVDDLLVQGLGVSHRAFGSTKMNVTESISAATYARLDRPSEDFDAIGFAKPLFRAEFLRSNSLRYKEYITLGEDFDFVMQALLKGANLRFIDYVGYRYNRGFASLSGGDRIERRSGLLDSNRELLSEAIMCKDFIAARSLKERGDAYLQTIDFFETFDALTEKRWSAFLSSIVSVKSKRFVYRTIAWWAISRFLDRVCNSFKS